MLIIFLSILHLTCSQELISHYIFSDCKHLILPPRCQCYHSGHESQLRCLRSELHSLPKLPNNMRWNALDFSFNYITAVETFVFADIYVEKINLAYNYLRRIEITAFDQIKNLKELRLHNNQLEELDPRALNSPGVSLEFLYMSHNLFQYLDIGEIVLKLPMLKELHLVSCQLNDTSIYTLSNLMKNTTDEYNQTIIRRGHSYLEILDLSYNNLTTICYDLFYGLYNLRELRLQHNSIRMVDNNFLRSFAKIRLLNLANNSLEHVPKLSSLSLEVLNLSSNHIHYLSDYFASNLRVIRLLDFDNNPQLNNTSPRAFCFLNLQSLERLTFRSNNLISLNTFVELLCRLDNTTEKLSLIDINNNTNLKCQCTLREFQKHLYHYSELTCTDQGQDRFYISNSASWFANCQFDFCSKRRRQIQLNPCIWMDAERVVSEGTCEAKLAAIEERKRNKSRLTSTTVSTFVDRQVFENMTDFGNITMNDNSTVNQLGKNLGSRSKALGQKSLLFLMICSVFSFSWRV